MGNVLAPAPAPDAPSFPALEEEPDCAELLGAFFSRQRSNWPLRAATRRWGAADAATTLTGGGRGGSGTPTRDATGITALHVAAANGWDELLDRLLETDRLTVDAASHIDGYTPLMIAAACGRRHAVDALLARGADPSKRSRRGASSLHFAAQTPQGQSVLTALLAHPSCTPALVRQTGFRDRSPLMLSVLSHGKPAIVQQLLAAGANPDERVDSMVLHTCVHMARLGALRTLIQAGADVDAVAADGISVVQEVFLQAPNQRCSEALKRQMFTELRQAGADVGARVTGKEMTVLHFVAAQCKEEATVNLLLDSDIDLTCGINEPVQLGDVRNRNTLLHLAANRGWNRLGDALVAPLHLAVIGRHSATVALLLRLGADPLAACPDLYPSYADWKLRKAMQAMQELMQGQGAAGGFQAAMLGMLGIDPAAAAADDATLTAVDLACCVARDIPTMEAFVERGVRPSAEALRLAEHAVPIMRAAVERPLWTPELHRRLPPRFRRAARELLLCLNRPVRGSDGRAPSSKGSRRDSRDSRRSKDSSQGHTLWLACCRVCTSFSLATPCRPLPRR
ncbi:hypothetical protein COHA_005779 [Chlorella ohadii]|uniref:Uncharacterized protein n=1 Tax=Chlorella ohadii TaxID=2649997 RepID=A0AAD5DQ56_9CHLO|nr:hypothetical protein COHA_005779 [Chlorella ohadii]